jgi:hypothetical protein
LFHSATAISRAGERFHLTWLIYNPILFVWMHMCSVRSAPTIFATFRQLFPDARRYLDVGAGTASVAAHGRTLGLDVEACEYAKFARWFAARQGVPCAAFDLTGAQPSPISADFDVAYCFEVGEHLPPSLSLPLARFMADRASRIVFSAAQPGQGGHGHINEQPPAYWIECFEASGCRYQPDVTEVFRDSVRTRAEPPQWLLSNVLIFDARE